MNTEFVIAIVSLVSVFVGYFVNDYFERQSEKFKFKSQAYGNFLEKVESCIPHVDGETLKDNSLIKELNKAMVILTNYAPNDVVREINILCDKYKKMDRPMIQRFRKILHNDLFQTWFFWRKNLKETDFPYFPFQQ